LGDLAKKFGWNHGELVKTLEEKRKVKSAAYYEKKKATMALRSQAEKEAVLPDDVKAILTQYGY
jgi:large subunit ribosomal protein L13Ae